MTNLNTRKSIRRVLHQLLRQTREHLIVYRDGHIIIDGIPANVFLEMGLSILTTQKWVMPTAEGFILTGSGTTLLHDWDQRFEPTTDITQTGAEQLAIIHEALRVIYNSQDHNT